MCAARAARPDGTNDVASGGGGDPDFVVPRNQVELLPFRVRHARVAQIAGVTGQFPAVAAAKPLSFLLR